MTEEQKIVMRMQPDFEQCSRCIWKASNPMWNWSREAGKVVALLTLILALSAQSFDANEIIIIGAFASAIGFDKFAEIKGWKSTVAGLAKSAATAVASKFSK